MKSRTSFVNKGIVFNDLKRFWWAGLAHLLIFLYFIPMRLLQMDEFILGKDGLVHIYMHDIIEENFMIIIMIIPVVIAILLFRYMHAKKTSVFVHSLPIKREHLYDSHIISGLIMVVIPILISMVVTLIVILGLRFNRYMDLNEVLTWFGIAAVCEITLFMSCVFVGMFTAFSISQGIFTYIFLSLPAVLGMLIFSNLKYLVWGFPYYDLGVGVGGLRYISPQIMIMELLDNHLDMRYEAYYKSIVIYLIVLLIFSVAFYILGKYAYKKRKTEDVFKLITFKWVEPVFKYGVTLCVMLVSLHMVNSISLVGILPAYFIGSLISYLICEILINKSIRAIKNIKGYLVYCAVIGIVLLGINFDITGYQSYVPKPEEVKNVYFSERFWHSGNEKVYEDRNNIENIISLNKRIIEDKHENKSNRRGTKEAAFIYELSNGKKITRSYSVDYSKYQNEYSELYKPILESREYKKTNYGIYNINSQDVININIRSNIDYLKRVNIGDSSNIKEILEILKEEINNMSYDDIVSSKEWGGIQIYLNDEEYHDEISSVYIDWKKSFEKFNDYLEQKNYLSKARILPDEVQYIVVERAQDTEKFNRGQERNIKRLEVKDKNKIEESLQVCEEDHGQANHEREMWYEIKIRLNNGDTYHGNLIRKEGAPKFIKEYFNE